MRIFLAICVAVIILLAFIVAFSPAQEKPKAKAVVATDTLVSRTVLITRLKGDIERLQTETERTIVFLRGQISTLEAMTEDSVRIKK